LLSPALLLALLPNDPKYEYVPIAATANTANTATVAASVLATSNGMSGKDWELGSTSSGSKNGAGDARVNVVGLVGAAFIALALLLGD